MQGDITDFGGLDGGEGGFSSVKLREFIFHFENSMVGEIGAGNHKLEISDYEVSTRGPTGNITRGSLLSSVTNFFESNDSDFAKGRRDVVGNEYGRRRDGRQGGSPLLVHLSSCRKCSHVIRQCSRCRKVFPHLGVTSKLLYSGKGVIR